MEKVQIHLEATLPELKDLYDKGLFTKNEIDDITRRRTAFETALVKQKVEKDDFYRYAEYEINLEQLRKVRWKRLGYHKNPPPRSASSFALQRRIVYILKRATAKFSSDLSVWIAYVEYASTQGMRKVVLQGLTKALQHHPLSPTLYLLLSYHHLHPGAAFPRQALPQRATVIGTKSRIPRHQREAEEAAKEFSMDGVQTARTTLLLGLRLLPRSRELWTEYVKLEVGWVEGLRRRWEILGIGALGGEKDKGKEVDDEELVGGTGAFGPDGEDARKAILRGQLVVHALSSALQAMTVDETPANEGLRFRRDLLALFRSYPSPLRKRCLDTVYEELGELGDLGGRAGAEARLMNLTRSLYDRAYDPSRQDTGGIILDGADLVEELGRIGKDIREQAKQGGQHWSSVAAKWLVERIEELEGSEELRAYLLSLLAALAKPSASPSPELLCLHLDCLSRHPSASTTSYLKTARSHAVLFPNDVALQSRRLAADCSQSTPSPEIRSRFKSLLEGVTRTGLAASQRSQVEHMWLSYVDWVLQYFTISGQSAPRDFWPDLLRSSIRHSAALPHLHARLLSRYFAILLESNPPIAPRALIAQIQMYRPTFLFWSIAFLHARRLPEPKALLTEVYEQLRGSAQTTDERVQAVSHWAGWLLSQGKGVEASRAVEVVRREVRQDARAGAELEKMWAEALDQGERGQAEEEGLEAEVERRFEEADAGEEKEVADGREEDVAMVQLERSQSGGADDAESFLRL